MSELPAWVKPKALIFYRPNKLLFFYESHIKRSNQLYLRDAPRGHAGAEYLLTDCEACNYLLHLKSAALLTIGGRPLSVERHGARLIIYSDTRRIAVDCDPKWWIEPSVVQAAESLADFFQGAIAWEVS
jgi:hypothetical protein